MSDSGKNDIRKEKREFLEREYATSADPNAKFAAKKGIEELDATTLGNAAQRSSDHADDGELTNVTCDKRDNGVLRTYFKVGMEHDPGKFKPLVDFDETAVRTFFESMGLAGVGDDGERYLTRAGVLFCCKEEYIPRKQFHIIIQYRDKVGKKPVNVRFDGSVLDLYFCLHAKLSPLFDRRMGSPEDRTGTGSESVVYEYPELAIVEALVNSLIHRDYSIDHHGSVVVYRDRIEFVNPGSGDYSAEELLATDEPLEHDRQYSRNKILIGAMNLARLNQMERSGIIRIKHALRQNGTIGPNGQLGLRIETDKEKDLFKLTIFKRGLNIPQSHTTETRVFIGSSNESIKVAYALQELISDSPDVSVTVWRHGLYEASDLTIEKLSADIGSFDFGVFVFTPDDLTIFRDEKHFTTRANVLLEFGMFLGRLGKRRCLIVQTEDVDIPADLAGFNTIRFVRPSNDSRSELLTSLGAAGFQLRDRIEILGPLENRKNNPGIGVNRQTSDVIFDASMLIPNLAMEVGRLENASPGQRLVVAYDCFQRHVQNIMDDVWSADEVVATFKTVDPEDPTKLIGRYNLDRFPIERRKRLAALDLPERFAIKKSLAGECMTTGEPKFVERLSSEKDRFSQEELEVARGIESMAAWPLTLDGKVVAVMKLESSSSGLFKESDERLTTLLGSVARLFEQAFNLLGIEVPTS